MHILLTVLEVIGGLFALVVILIIAFALLLTKDGSNPFQ